AGGGWLGAARQWYGYAGWGPEGLGAAGLPASTAEVDSCRAKIRDHLDLLRSLLDRGILEGDRGHPAGTVLDTQNPHPGEPPIGYRALTEAVQLVSPEPAEMLLRAGAWPESDVQIRELLNIAGFGPRRTGLLELLARPGIGPD